jgi:DNA modification methylase
MTSTQQLLPLKEIKEGVRFREDYGDIAALAISIKHYGLLQPLVLDRSNNLLAGGRRYRACLALGLDTIPIIYIDQVDPLKAREIELEENIARQNLNIVEEAKLVKAIHDLKISIHGQASGNRFAQVPGWSQGDTALSLDKTQSYVSKQIAFANAIAVMPELEDVGSKVVAMKLVEKRIESIQRELSIRQAKHEEATIYCAPAAETLSSLILPDSIDLIILDPPYGVDIDGEGYRTGVHFDDSEKALIEYLETTLPELSRVLKRDGHLYCFSSSIHVQKVYDLLIKHDLTPDPIPLIWIKNTFGRVDWSHRYAPAYEPIWFVNRGRMLSNFHKNYFQWELPTNNNRYKGFEKPVAGLEELIQLSSKPGEIVLDPCCGSGTTPIAAKLQGRKYIAIDIDQDCINLTKLRLAEVGLPLPPTTEDDDDDLIL